MSRAWLLAVCCCLWSVTSSVIAFGDDAAPAVTEEPETSPEEFDLFTPNHNGHQTFDPTSVSDGRLIAVGQFSRVFRARRLKDNQNVALKFMSSSFDGDYEIARELVVTDKLSVRCKEYFPAVLGRFKLPAWTAGGLRFVHVMELLDGIALGDAINRGAFGDVIRHRPTTAPDIARIHRVWSLAKDAVACLHRAGYIHGDIKLANFVYRHDAIPEHATIKLIDFDKSLRVVPPPRSDSVALPPQPQQRPRPIQPNGKPWSGCGGTIGYVLKFCEPAQTDKLEFSNRWLTEAVDKQPKHKHQPNQPLTIDYYQLGRLTDLFALGIIGFQLIAGQGLVTPLLQAQYDVSKQTAAIEKMITELDELTRDPFVMQSSALLLELSDLLGLYKRTPIEQLAVGLGFELPPAAETLMGSQYPELLITHAINRPACGTAGAHCPEGQSTASRRRTHWFFTAESAYYFLCLGVVSLLATLWLVRRSSRH